MTITTPQLNDCIVCGAPEAQWRQGQHVHQLCLDALVIDGFEQMELWP